MLYCSRLLRLEKPLLEGPDVFQLQTMLKHAGCFSGSIDGIFGSRTSEGLIDFQKRYNLYADGIADPNTWLVLNSDAAPEEIVIKPLIPENKDSEITQFATPKITIDVDQRKLYYSSENSSLVYPVGVGKSQTPTPLGHWKIVQKAVNPGGPFGARWMRLNIPWGGYGIHGTNNPKSVSKALSHGCLRLLNPDVIHLYDLTPIGTPITIIGKAYTGKILSKGSSGSEVQAVQRILKSLGYYKSSIDGTFSSKTERAIKEFQQANGQKDDGIVGNATYIAMQKAVNQKNNDIDP